MCSVSEKPAVEKPTSDSPQSPLGQTMRVNNLHVSPRRRKETLLPEITRLALEGQSGQAIARTLGLPKRTVNHWLQKLRQEWLAQTAEDAAELMAIKLARLDAVYREAMQAWRDSRTAVRVRTIEESEAGGENGKSTKKKTSVRTEAPRPNAALLTRATEAVKASCKLTGCAAASRRNVAGRPPRPLEKLAESNCRRLSKTELDAVRIRAAALAAASGAGPAVPTPDDLKRKNHEEISTFG